MTVDTEVGAGGSDAQYYAEEIHEFCINQLGYNTYDVLATAHRDGRVTLTLEEGVALEDEL